LPHSEIEKDQPMIRAAHVTDSISRRAGGLFETVRGLCSTLNTFGEIQAEVFAGEDEFTNLDKNAWNGVPTHIAPTTMGPIGQSIGIYRRLQSSPFDLAHLHGIWGIASLSIALSKIRHNKWPYIITPGGMLEPWALRTKSLKKNIGWWLWQGSLLKQAACIHALCDAEAVSIANLNLARPICIIPNGVGLPEAPLERGPISNTLLFLGRIHPKKGLVEFLSAFARIEQSQRHSWRIIIAGWDDGGHLPVLQSLARELGIESSVEFVGPVFGDEKIRLFRCSTAFILPSHSEGMPMSVLEAWSYGLPVVISKECHLDIGYQRGAAIHVDPNVPSIELGLRTLFTKPIAELAAMGENGRALVAQQFCWESVARQFALVYEWMLGGPKPACVV
jgi:glycosyltransferase involved in cell wall biosynthesis